MGRNLVGFTRELDFFFFRFYFLFRSGSSLLTIESYTRSIVVSPAFFQCCFDLCTLYEVPTRLLSLPPFYRSLGVRDPYFGCSPTTQPVLLTLRMSLSEGSSSRGSSSLGFNSSGSSSSGFLDQSPLPHSMTNRGSHSEIPGQLSGEEVGQHFNELPDSFRSSREASVSGSAEVDFCSRGIFL